MNDNTKNDFGLRLGMAIRFVKGCSINEYAKMIGITVRRLNNIFNERNKPNFDILKRILETGISVDNLLGGNGYLEPKDKEKLDEYYKDLYGVNIFKNTGNLSTDEYIKDLEERLKYAAALIRELQKDSDAVGIYLCSGKEKWDEFKKSLEQLEENGTPFIRR